MSRICVAPIEGKGRCVFAKRPIAKGEPIDTNYVLLFPIEQHDEMKAPLALYPLRWDKDFHCMALGAVSLANHSSDAPNASVQRCYAQLLIRLVAERDIEAGEEIVYDYKAPLWFEPKPPARLNMETKNGITCE